MQNLVSDAANVLYTTSVCLEQSVVALHQDIGIALSWVEAAIVQVGSSVQSLGFHIKEISSEQRKHWKGHIGLS